MTIMHALKNNSLSPVSNGTYCSRGFAMLARTGPEEESRMGRCVPQAAVVRSPSVRSTPGMPENAPGKHGLRQTRVSALRSTTPVLRLAHSVSALRFNDSGELVVYLFPSKRARRARPTDELCTLTAGYCPVTPYSRIRGSLSYCVALAARRSSHAVFGSEHCGSMPCRIAAHSKIELQNHRPQTGSGSSAASGACGVW